jgi:hypothetical protein
VPRIAVGAGPVTALHQSHLAIRIMRTPEEMSPEDRQRVEQYTHTGIHAVERKPFRPGLLLLLLLAITSLLSVLAIVIERIYIP